MAHVLPAILLHEIDSNNSSNSEMLHTSDDDWEGASDSEVEDNGPLHKKAFRAALRKAPAANAPAYAKGYLV